MWAEVSTFIENEVVETHSYKRKKYRKSLRKAWTTGRQKPACWLSLETYPYVRSKVLYMLFPANRTISPALLVALVIAFVPLFGLNIVIFLVLFIMIDKTDEFQLVQYICSIFAGIRTNGSLHLQSTDRAVHPAAEQCSRPCSSSRAVSGHRSRRRSSTSPAYLCRDSNRGLLYLLAD